jgi:hypothetical protein
MQKVRYSRISEHSDHNENEHRASLEKGNVDAESVRIRRRPPAGSQASNASSDQCHRGIGDGMSAKARRVNMGSPRGRGARPQLLVREEQSRPTWVAERPVVARNRVMIEERRGLSSSSAQKQQEPGRLM